MPHLFTNCYSSSFGGAQGLASGTMGGTYGAGPLAAAAACATLDVIRDEDLLGNAERRGRQLVAVRAHSVRLLWTLLRTLNIKGSKSKTLQPWNL